MNLSATDHIRSFRKSPAMRALRWLSCLLSISVYFTPLQAFAFDQTHRLFTAELRKYVRPEGVLYGEWKEHQDGLDHYLDSLAQLTEKEYDSFSPQERKSLWLNAYNALAVKLILKNY